MPDTFQAFVERLPVSPRKPERRLQADLVNALAARGLPRHRARELVVGFLSVPMMRAWAESAVRTAVRVHRTPYRDAVALLAGAAVEAWDSELDLNEKTAQLARFPRNVLGLIAGRA